MTRSSLPIRLGIAVLNLLIYSLVWILYLSDKPVGVPAYWKNQFYIILIISTFLLFLIN